MIVAVAGASGFVGRALSAHMTAAGHDVIALGRTLTSLPPDARGIEVDVGDESATADALAGVDAAYYLVHSMASGDGFRRIDLRLATSFGRAAARAGVGRIVYVGALGDSPSSEHLVSRHEVGSALGAGGVPVVELRAAVVIGSGSISFEMLRYLTERLPVMVCPRWVRTRIQPIALVDLVAYLDESLYVAPGVYEIGGAEVTTYREMISEYARVRGLLHRRILDIPWLTPHLSSYWVDLVTPVDRSISHALIESLVTEVVVVDPEPASRAFSTTPMGVAQAVAAALHDQEEGVTRSFFARDDGLTDGVYRACVTLPIPPGLDSVIARDLRMVGGKLAWYGAVPGWVLRLVLGRLLGERLRRARPETVAVGAIVDWWRIVIAEPDQLVLRSVGWFPGDAWLGYRVGEGSLRQVAAFRPRGVPGFLYWKLLGVVHRVAFERMARRRVTRALGDLGRPRRPDRRGT